MPHTFVLPASRKPNRSAYTCNWAENKERSLSGKSRSMQALLFSMHNTRFFKCDSHIGKEFIIRGGGRAFPRYKNNAVVSLCPGQIFPKRFLQPSSRLISRYAVAHFFTDRKPGPRTTIPALCAYHRKIFRGIGLPAPVRKTKLLVLFQGLQLCRAPALHIHLGRQSFPAFCTPALKHISARFCAHSAHETVRAASHPFFGLVGHFHNASYPPFHMIAIKIRLSLYSFPWRVSNKNVMPLIPKQKSQKTVFLFSRRLCKPYIDCQ